MKSNNRTPWARFGFEGALIVISILAAFGIDSWWSARQLAAEEQEMLVQLKFEFETNALLLAETRKRTEEIISAAESLLQVTGPDYNDKHVDIEAVKRAIYMLKFWGTYNPQMGVLAGVTQSGKLRMISSDRLLNTLAAWPARVQDAAENEIHLGKFTTESLTPYLTERSSARNMGAISHVGTSRFSVEVESMLTDFVFENLIYEKLVSASYVLEEYGKLAATIDNILQLIDHEIDAI